jgi:hypothetical protein
MILDPGVAARLCAACHLAVKVKQARLQVADTAALALVEQQEARPDRLVRWRSSQAK